MRAGKNHEGYPDPTASYAVGHLTHEEKQKRKKQKEEKKRGCKSNVLGNTHFGRSVSHGTGAVRCWDGSALPLPAKGRQDKKRVHRGAEKGGRRTDSGNQGNAGKERRKATEEAEKKE